MKHNEAVRKIIAAGFKFAGTRSNSMGRTDVQVWIDPVDKEKVTQVEAIRIARERKRIEQEQS